VAIWGCGPVGQLAIRCAYLFGAERVIAIDGEPARLEMAAKHGKAYRGIRVRFHGVPQSANRWAGT